MEHLSSVSPEAIVPGISRETRPILQAARSPWVEKDNGPGAPPAQVPTPAARVGESSAQRTSGSRGASPASSRRTVAARATVRLDDAGEAPRDPEVRCADDSPTRAAGVGT